MSSGSPKTEAPHVRPGRARVATASAVAAVVVVAALTAHGLQLVSGAFAPASLATTGLLFALLGALVLVRQPDNVLGTVMAVLGVASVLGALAEAVTTVTWGTERMAVPGAVWAGWVAEWYWLPVMWLQFVVIPLLFPDGRPTSVGWRRFGIVTTGAAGVLLLLAAGGQELVVEPIQLGLAADSTRVVVLDNPVGFLPLGNLERDVSGLVVLVPLCAVGAAVSLVQRFRRSHGTQRRQLKVAVTGIAVSAVGFAALAAVDTSRSPVLTALEVPLLLLIPAAFGVAILRYRLYDIDRIVSRTVAWATVTVLLVALYLGAVVALQAVLGPLLGDGDMPVALATLVAAASGRPLLRRVQDFVDRRFNRARYDAARTIEDFARGLRDELGLESVVADLRSVASATFHPEHADVLLLPARETGS